MGIALVSVISAIMTPTSQPTAKIGLIGLGVMGQNLALNIARNGYPVAVYDREPEVIEKFITDSKGAQLAGAPTPEEFVRSLERPRKIILLVKAGDPVDWTIKRLLVRRRSSHQDIVIPHQRHDAARLHC